MNDLSGSVETEDKRITTREDMANGQACPSILGYYDFMDSTLVSK